MNAAPLSLGLIGYPLGHSLSPRLHTAALQALGLAGEYRLYPLQPGPSLEAGLADLLARMRCGEIAGLNVTIPHKQAVTACLDERSPTAHAVGAVNTLLLRAGRLVGENTDVPGLLGDLRRVFPGLEPAGMALVLGAGGAARAAAYALAVAGWRVSVAARRPEQAAALAEALDAGAGVRIEALALDADGLNALVETPRLVVNASAAGMAPRVEESPWPQEIPLPTGACVYDLVYSPAETALLRRARRAGLAAAGGLGMLVEQAALALELWTGLAAPRAAMWAAVENQNQTHRHGDHGN